MIKPGDFSKYASSKEAAPWGQIAATAAKGVTNIGRSFLKGVSGRAGEAGVQQGAKRLMGHASRAAKNVGGAVNWAAKNPGTALGLGAGALHVKNRLLGPSQQQQPDYGRMY